VKAFFGSGEQSGEDAVVDFDDVEQDLVLGLPCGGHLRCRRSGARQQRASAELEDYRAGDPSGELHD